MSTAIYWFRQDLRCQDNPALTYACEQHTQLIPLYIRESKPTLVMGGAQKWWLHHSLAALKNSLNKLGLDLHLRSGEPLTLLKQLIQEYEVEAVYWNRCYEPMYTERDRLIKAELKALGIKVLSCNGSLLNEPWEVKNQSGSYFKVYTPYWSKAVAQIGNRDLFRIKQPPLNYAIASESLAAWDLTPNKPDWAKEFPDYWRPGEQGAILKLEKFLEGGIRGYKDARNTPALSATSRLSPHLHFGDISPYQIWNALKNIMVHPECDRQSAHIFLKELGWREFSYHLLYHYPKLMEQNFKSQFDSFPWQNDDQALHLWQQGMTGYPLVDAGMRELWRTGYMHNRVRMIVASFLTKDLMIDWRKGAAWFWDTLLDADLANNSASWQWVAGSGADAAPYYRVFNPVLQSEKFDTKGEYIRRWVPELRALDNKWIHRPWEAPKGELPIVLGQDYPYPVVDHAMARQVALSSYKLLGKG